MMKREQKNYYIQQKLPKSVHAVALEKRKQI